jgi:hypothetical protein
MGIIPLRFVSARVIVIVGCLIGERTGISVHPLTGVCTIHIPITVMGAGKGDWGSALAASRIIMLLGHMVIMTPLARINLGQYVTKAPPALQKVPD